LLSTQEVFSEDLNAKIPPTSQPSIDHDHLTATTISMAKDFNEQADFDKTQNLLKPLVDFKKSDDLNLQAHYYLADMFLETKILKEAVKHLNFLKKHIPDDLPPFFVPPLKLEFMFRQTVGA